MDHSDEIQEELKKAMMSDDHSFEDNEDENVRKLMQEDGLGEVPEESPEHYEKEDDE